MTATQKVKVYLTNLQTLGAMCGYGIGRTREDAIASALRIARERDANAYYDAQSGSVCFGGGINC